MFPRIVPGHFRAVTLVMMIVTGAFSFILTQEWRHVVGVVVLLLGAFVADQATHLHQEDHSGPRPTWIEEQLQKHYPFSVTCGIILVILGIFTMIVPYTISP
jgi:uncharacterized membrane protein YkgB